MNNNTIKINETSHIDRRSFIKNSLVLAGALAGSSALIGCTNTVSSSSSSSSGSSSGSASPVAAGEWIPAACWHNCGGRCYNQVLVKDKVVVRQKTDDLSEDSLKFPQQRSCLRGRSQRKQVFAEDRLKYPMKRKNWQPGGGENSKGNLRGIDEWERISWDEAINYIADEVKRIVDNYGNRAILADGGESSKMLALFGGYIPQWGTSSYGSWALAAPLIGTNWGWPNILTNDRLDMLNSEVVICLGLNPAWSSPGNPAYYMYQIKKAGAKFIAVDPFYNDSYALVEADWIPCLPSTDIALFLGVANAMLEMDKEKGLIDWDFLDRCTIGFDAEHMPDGEDPKGNFKDYVLGTFDGIPKTPEWASPRCGVTPEKIRYLAEMFGKDKRVAVLFTWASARTHSSDTLPQLMFTLAAMGGHFGKSGHTCGISAHIDSFNGGDRIMLAGSKGTPGITNPLAATEQMNRSEIWKAILEDEYTYAGTAYVKVPGVKKAIDIKMILHDAMTAMLATTDGQSDGIKAHRKVEFVVSVGMFYGTNPQYSDIVLPIISQWETESGYSGYTPGREFIMYWSQITEPMFECKSDREIAQLLGEKLGVDVASVYPMSEKQERFNQHLGATILNKNGERTPFLTITEADITEWGCEGKPQEGVVSIKDFIKSGKYQVERTPGDEYTNIAYKAFVQDPEANPLKSESGKFEIYCRSLRDQVNGIGWSKIEAIPTYIPPQEGYEATFSDFENGIKGEYPYQVYNPHYLRRSHVVFDNVVWARELWKNPFFINPITAKECGLVTGDTALITSPHGKTLRKACVTNRFPPGVIGVPHGAWVDIDERTGIDRAGSDNILTGQIQSGQGTSGWNTCICKVEKYGSDLPEDINLPLRIPSAQA